MRLRTLRRAGAVAALLAGGTTAATSHVAHSPSMMPVAAAVNGPAQLAATTSTPSTVTVHRDSHWAGYAALSSTDSRINDVISDWIVPSVKCDKTNESRSSAWVGMGGGNNKTDDTLYQMGTESSCLKDSTGAIKPTYWAWFETYPQYAERPFDNSAGNVTVQPNDHILAELFTTPDNNVRFWIEDYGQTWPYAYGTAPKWSRDFILPAAVTSFTGSRQGECIIERPLDTTTNTFNLLPNFGSISFPPVDSEVLLPGCKALTTDYHALYPSSTRPAAPGYTFYQSQMYAGKKQLALTSNQSGDGTFTVKWKASR